MRHRLILTGGTGFLGKQLVPLLRKDFDVDVMSRSGRTEIKGDLTKWKSGLGDLEPLKGRYQGFVHLAGLYDLNATKSACYLQNVLATGEALRLSRELGITHFFNTSSVAAAINAGSDPVEPAELNFSAPFPDAYSESKAFAEERVQSWPDKGLIRVNFRPGALVGSRETGAIDRIDGPYYAARSFERLKKALSFLPGPLFLPGEENRRLPLVPVDACAHAMAEIIKMSFETKFPPYSSYHLVPREGLPILDFYRSALKHALVSVRSIHLVHRVPQGLLKKTSKWLLGLPEAQLTYLLNFPRYKPGRTTDLLGEWCPEFRDYESVFWRGYDEFVSNR